MKVVLAEKPSVAKDIARVLGATSRENGYFEGNLVPHEETITIAKSLEVKIGLNIQIF